MNVRSINLVSQQPPKAHLYDKQQIAFDFYNNASESVDTVLPGGVSKTLMGSQN